MSAPRAAVRHFDSHSRLAESDVTFVRDLQRTLGNKPTATLLETSVPVIDRILGPGTLIERTRARITTRIAALRKAS